MGYFYKTYIYIKENTIKKISEFLAHLKARLTYAGKDIQFHHSSYISPKSKMRIINGGSITIGKNCEIYDYVIMITYGGKIKIGDNCSINPFSVIYGNGGLKIGNGVRIAAQTVIIPANHKFNDKEMPIYLQGETREGITIEDDIWIGAGCKILDGIKIGKGSVIGAGSVVNNSMPEYSVAVGVPAKVISKRGEV